MRPSEVVLELAFGVKCEVVNALIANQSLSKASVKASEETRLKMIRKNNSLAARLMKLPVSVSQSTDVETDGQMSNGRRCFRISQLKASLKIN